MSVRAQRDRLGWLRTLGWWLVLCSATTAGAWAVEPDATDLMLREMCQRGLAPTAVEICRVEIVRAGEQPPLRSRWTMRLMECQAQAALRGGATATAAWQAALQTEADYRERYPDDPRLPWLAWQAARIELLRSQAALVKWLAAPADEASRETALAAVRRMQSALDQLETDIRRRLPIAQVRSGSSATEAPGQQLLELSIDGTLLRCESLLVRAMAYPPQSKDRIAAASDVYRVASEVLERAPLNWPARDELLVAQATAGLATGRVAESLRMLEQIVAGQSPRPPGADAGEPAGVNSADVPPAVSQPSLRARTRAGSVAIEALCAENELSRARQVLAIMQSQLPGPETELADLRVRLADLAQAPAETRDAALRTVLDLAQAIGNRHGDYWQRRGEALLVHAGTKTTGSADAELTRSLLIAEVRQLLAAGKEQEATARLAAASRNVLATGAAQAALELATQAAALHIRQKAWLPAADLLREVAQAQPAADGAAAAHVQGCWALAQELRSRATDTELMQQYQHALEEHLRLWPEETVSRQVEDWLIGWYQQRQDTAQLLQLWQQQFTLSQQDAHRLRALRRWLDVVLGQASAAEQAAAVQWLQAALQVQAPSPALPAALRTAMELHLLAAYLLSSDMNLEEAQRETGRQLSATSPSDQAPAELALWRAVLALGAARRGDSVACTQFATHIVFDDLSSSVIRSWLAGLLAAVDEQPPALVENWPAALVSAPEWAAVARADDPPRWQAVGLRVELLRGLARRPSPLRDPQLAAQALAPLQALMESAPRSGELRLHYAAALAQCQPDRLGDALRLVKQVAVAAEKTSPLGLRARWLELCWLRTATSPGTFPPEAARLAELTLTTRDIAPAWMKSRFQAIAGRKPQ
jgi:hypothetical protein